jgi:hypothetical protein
MNPVHDEDIDALLRQSFDGPALDAGFSDRVMQHVRPRRRASSWPLVVCVFAGALMCWLSLSGSPLWRAAWQGWLAGVWSSSTIITLAMMAAMSLLALGWTLAEADDH